jgi:hypothetical protein
MHKLKLSLLPEVKMSVADVKNLKIDVNSPSYEADSVLVGWLVVPALLLAADGSLEADVGWLFAPVYNNASSTEWSSNGKVRSKMSQLYFIDDTHAEQSAPMCSLVSTEVDGNNDDEHLNRLFHHRQLIGG